MVQTIANQINENAQQAHRDEKHKHEPTAWFQKLSEIQIPFFVHDKSAAFLDFHPKKRKTIVVGFQMPQPLKHDANVQHQGAKQ